MTENEWLAEKFQENRNHLRTVAYRILGSNWEADDAVQEAWLRLTRSDARSPENLGGWLTTVVARICLDMLRSRKSRKEESLEEQLLEAPEHPHRANPADETLLADSVGSALLIVLTTLTPAERVAFVLHDLFALPFEEIAPIVGRSETAARQLASRARRRVRGGHEGREDEVKKREIVSAFLVASREGNFNALLQLLDPEILLTADDVAVKVTEANKAKGAPPLQSEMRGAKVVAETFKGRALGAELALINGSVGTTWIGGGKPRVAFLFSLENGKIQGIDVVMDPEDLKEMEVEPLEYPGGRTLDAGDNTL
jgi:RNA polymerase sigma-70 factor (ECF subfamily)